MPVAFGLYAMLARPRRRAILALWTVLSLIPFVPVFIVLDASLWWFGSTGVPTFAGTVVDVSLLYGPLLRTLPLVSMAALLADRRVGTAG